MLQQDTTPLNPQNDRCYGIAELPSQIYTHHSNVFFVSSWLENCINMNQQRTHLRRMPIQLNFSLLGLDRKG
uniref:Uncharacterized protein n=1 Tax=Utricularia reniformis TaxID=192314 RepID=A0A1Y0B0R7_9LAMI|nr:hypothetical protein AEK19_MT0809 [Utricularia reniformis]ART31046.1 hypothetical protein AEK19_MT0809 [Utricularia reniformis]